MRPSVRIGAALAWLLAATLPAAAQTALQANTNLNVRTGPGTGYSIIGLMPAGSVYCAIEKSSNWWKIQYDSRTGWVSGGYCSTLPGQTGVKVTTTPLNVRGGPGTGYAILGTVNSGQVFWWSTTSSGWYKVNWNGRTGWMSGLYLSRVNLAGTASPQQILLNVPMISQLPELPTGCEITAVTMMLKYKGANVTKTMLADEMPRSTNPNYGFVGNPYDKSGWTIYPSALMDLVRKYAGSAVNLTGSPVSALELQIQRNIPVVVWVTLHGFSVHAITVTGYDPNNLYYNDPWTGQKNAAMVKSAFESIWILQSRRAISY